MYFYKPKRLICYYLLFFIEIACYNHYLKELYDVFRFYFKEVNVEN